METIKVEKKGQVTLIGLNRPKNRNAFTYEMVRELSQAYTDYENDDEARCAVLYAEGKHFTLGLELPEFSADLEKAGELPVVDGGIDPFGLNGGFRSKPVVCAVQGYCYTIGIELMLASDINVVAKGSKFAQMEVGRGLLPYCGGSFRFIERAGWHNAMRYILTSDIFDDEEARRIGLVQEITDKGAQLDRAVEIAETICKQSPLGVKYSLRQSRQYVEAAEADGRRDLMQNTLEIMKTDDFAEGVKSFQKKRPADFG